MKEIKEITIKALNNATYFSYHSGFLKALETDSKVKEKVKTQLEAYKTALAKVEKALAVSQKRYPQRKSKRL